MAMVRIRQWPYTFAMALSILVGAVAVFSSLYLDLPLRDPDGFLGPSYIRLPVLALAFVGVGIFVQALRRSGGRKLPTTMVEVARQEWNLRRALYTTAGLLSFYVCYVSYRNLKSVLPIYREGVLYDQQLLQLDNWMGGGNDPAVILHDLLGTGFAAHLLSGVYLSYLLLVPLSLGVFLVFSRNYTIGAWYATTLSLNWVLGVVSYYTLPTLGPVFARPEMYSALPETGVSRLQEALIENRIEYISDPVGSDSIQGVAGFASLHVSVTFAAALFLVRTNQKLFIRTIAWIFFGVTCVATLYFGWHYILDDIAGVLIGWATVTIGAWATGNWMTRSQRLMSAVPKPYPEPA